MDIHHPVPQDDPESAELEFRLLGPLEVRRGGAPVPLAGGKQRAVLAALLLSAGRVVSLGELTEALWGPSAPVSARVTVQNYVTRLRKALGDGGRDRIQTVSQGYLIRAASHELDSARFEALLDAARAAARQADWAAAAARAAEALALWRGEPLADTGSELLAARELPRLAELRAQAIEAQLEAEVHLGRRAGVIGELRRLALLYPLRERVHGLLMLALYLDGRQGEALAAYQQARQLLNDELGAEPGAALRDLHQRVLAADPALARSAPGQPPGASPGPPVPRQLPAGVPHFTGRAGELATLTGLLDHPGQAGPATVVVSAIGGTAGVGKTEFAVRWAHQVAGRFPDGQLYVNLRGYDPGRPLAAADALAGFLRALGVAGRDIPAATDERAARYRTLLAGRRMLVLLDNAASADQVRPLLPGSPGCATVVTSRGTLAGLVARHGATRLDLGLLPPAESAELLRELIGGRADADPAATAALAVQCCHLPLALRVAAELASARPAAPLAGLVAELADRQRRLDLLDVGGDTETAVRTVFSWSWQHLSPAAGRAFRLLGLHPGTDLDLHAAAALLGAAPGEAGDLLEELARAYLIQPARPGRYQPHDLLRAYAAELTAALDSDADRRAALTRLLDHYLHTAATAMDILRPGDVGRRPRVLAPGTAGPPLAGVVAARAWLDGQRASLVAAAEHACAHGWPGHSITLAATLYRYLDTGGHYPEAIAIHSSARAAARDTGDVAAEAMALTSIGMIERRQGRYDQAAGSLREALALYRTAGDQRGEARVLSNLAGIDLWRGRYAAATGLLTGALELCRQAGDRAGEARAVATLGGIEQRQGRYPQAARRHRAALALYRQAGHTDGEAQALNNLGGVQRRMGRFDQAARHHQQALALYRQAGDRPGEAYSLGNLGGLYLRQGRYDDAARYLRQALALCQQTGDRPTEAYALSYLGDVCLRQGRPDQAARHQQQALELFREAGDPAGEAQALNGLGEAHLTAGQPGLARGEHERALELASRIGDRDARDRAGQGLAGCARAGCI